MLKEHTYEEAAKFGPVFYAYEEILKKLDPGFKKETWHSIHQVRTIITLSDGKEIIVYDDETDENAPDFYYTELKAMAQAISYLLDKKE